MNKKKKSTNISPYPDEVIDRLARAFYPAILACWNSEEGQREFAAWQAEQAHHATNEKQEAPIGELPVVHIAIVCGFWQGASFKGAPCFLCCLFQIPHLAPNLTTDALIFFVSVQELLQPVLQQIVFLFVRHKNQTLSYFILTAKIKVLLPSSR